MKRLLLLASLLCLFSIIPFNANAETVGPVIKGFQLGQTLDEVKSIADKSGLILEPPTDASEGMFGDYFCMPKDKAGESHLFDSVVIFYINKNNNTVKTILFNDTGLTKLFNATGRRTGFIQAFLDNYDTLNTLDPIIEENPITGQITTSYQYISDQEGWKIKIGTSDSKEATSIQLKTIEKTGAFKF